jgi:putative glycosyltransferase (TIGR04372 family)
MLPFAVMVVGIFLLLRPFVIIQIYKVHDWRIGHMVSTTQRRTFEIKEWNSDHLRKKILVYFFGSRTSANDYYRDILKRQHASIQGHWGFLLFYISSFFKFIVPNSDYSVLDKAGLLLKYPVGLKFNSFEISEGKKFLASCGLNQNSKYVCLNVRDSAYLSETRKKDFKKHELRNSDINTYIDSIKALIGAGYAVFRMGSVVENYLDFNHPLFFDYASNGTRTEFLDIFLGANCTFCISTGSGWDEIPRVFKRPTVYVNFLPILASTIITRDLLLFPKYMRDGTTNELLSLNELLSSFLYGQSDPFWIHEYNGVVQDLSSDDLKHATLEMVARIEGHLTQVLMSESKFQPSAGYFPIRAEFATRFFSQNPKFLD